VYNPLGRLGQAPKHHPVDLALAARLLGATERSLIDDSLPEAVPRRACLLGVLFESLAAMAIRVCLATSFHHFRSGK